MKGEEEEQKQGNDRKEEERKTRLRRMMCSKITHYSYVYTFSELD